MTIFETINIKVTGLTCIIWHMKGNSPVQAQNQEVQIVTNTNTCSQSQIVQEMTQAKFGVGEYLTGFWIIIILVEVPDVTGIKE